jgi:integrase
MTVELEEQPQRRQRRQGLTDKQIAAKPRRAERYTEADPEQRGLYLRIPSAGPITFAVAERNPYGTKVWAKIGTTADMTIDEARERARAAIRRIKDGLPAFEAPPKQPDTYRDVAELWMQQHVEKEGLRTRDEIRRLLDRVLVFWGKKNFADIKRRDASALLNAVEAESGPWAADHVLAVIRKISSWHAVQDGDYVSPFVAGMRRTRSEARTRDRVLDESELRKVWRSAEADDGSFGALVRLLLLTAQRREKLVSLKWTDIDAGGIWEIRSEPREKGNPGAVRLPPAALAIIEAQQRIEGNPYVFAASRGNGPLSGFNKRKAAFDEACGVTGWTLHDLRRTARSLMSAAGVPSEIAERALGHKLTGVRAVYDRFAYFEEKSAALSKLAAEIKRVVKAGTP